MENHSDGSEPDENRSSEPYQPRHSKPRQMITSLGLLDFSLQRLSQHAERLGMDKQRKIYDLSDADRKRFIFGEPLSLPSTALRVVINEHIDNSIETYAGIFVDDIIVTRNGIANNMGYVPLDVETGDLPDNLEYLPPVAWRTESREWDIIEGSEELVFPLPRDHLSYDGAIRQQVRMVGYAVMALREVTAAHDVTFL